MARKPAKKSRKRTTPSKTEPTPSPEGRLWFDEHGRLKQSGPVPLSRYLGALSDQLRLFLARLDSCERTDAGGYLLQDSRAGSLGGMRVLWDNAVLLAQAIIAMTLPRVTPDRHAAMRPGEVRTTTTAPVRDAIPLADALRQLLFSILYNADGSFPSEIPLATVYKIRTIGDELTQHRTVWERSEGGPARISTGTLDPGAIDRAAERAAEKVARVFGAGDSGGAKPKTLPAGAEPIDEHDVALLAFLNRNPSMRRKVSDVLPERGPQDRKAVAKRLRKLADRKPPLVDYPKKARSGVAILPAGEAALNRATAPTTR